MSLSDKAGISVTDSQPNKGTRDMPVDKSLADIAREVSKQLVRDNAHRQRILQRSPHVFSAMDAGEVAQASSRELAARELKELGIDCADNDPVALLDAHHAGRQYARDGGKRSAGMDSAGETFVDRYLQGCTNGSMDSSRAASDIDAIFHST